MFSFFNRPKKALITTDIHAHLIPGIDDGPKSFAESIRLIKGLSELGYKRLYATPHVYQELYPNDRLDILAGFEVLKRHLEPLNLDVEIYPAAEYFLDEYFLELLKKDELLPIGDNYLLVEDSFYERKDLIENYIFQIRVSGYQPILAHPERYLHIGKNKDRFGKLKEMGCLFQLNLLSLLGHYGAEVKNLAKFLLKNGYIDFLGTDLHNEPQLKQLKKLKKSKFYKQLLANNTFQNERISSRSAMDKIG